MSMVVVPQRMVSKSSLEVCFKELGVQLHSSGVVLYCLQTLFAFPGIATLRITILRQNLIGLSKLIEGIFDFGQQSLYDLLVLVNSYIMSQGVAVNDLQESGQVVSCQLLIPLIPGQLIQDDGLFVLEVFDKPSVRQFFDMNQENQVESIFTFLNSLPHAGDVLVDRTNGDAFPGLLFDQLPTGGFVSQMPKRVYVLIVNSRIDRNKDSLLTTTVNTHSVVLLLHDSKVIFDYAPNPAFIPFRCIDSLKIYQLFVGLYWFESGSWFVQRSERRLIRTGIILGIAMNLSPENLKLLQEANQLRIGITTDFVNGQLTRDNLLEKLLQLQVHLYEAPDISVREMDKKNNIAICQLLNSKFEEHKPKKLFKIPPGCMEEVLRLHAAKTTEVNVPAKRQESLKTKPNPKDKKGETKQEQKDKVQEGFVPASTLLKVNGNKGDVSSANTIPNTSSVGSLRKKFVPPFKKEEPLVYDQEEDATTPTDPRYKNLDPKLIQSIQSEILQSGAATKWSDIAGLGFAKKTIHEMIVWPMLRPDIFVGLRAPPKGVLLFGPPGTGKTLIGKAIASESKSTFFNISASSLTSKWVGEGEKLVRTLFAVALVKQPSVIFIDEIDSLLCSRSEGEQQSSRKIKTQFLVQLDGAKSSSGQRILVIGATNRPSELDQAIRRRFVKRLYIPLPNQSGRQELIRTISEQNGFHLSKQDIVKVAQQTKGYSGADLHNLCAQAAMFPLRKISDINNINSLQVPQTTIEDIFEALKFVKSSVNNSQLTSYQQWNKVYGSYQFESTEQYDS